MSTIVLAEDHVVVRQRLKDLLNLERDFQIVGEAADGLHAVQLVSELQPHALVTDLMMPGLNGFEVISRIRLTGPDTRIVLISVESDEPYVIEAFRRGAKGFVQKQMSSTQLVPALRTVLAGGCYLSPPCSVTWLADLALETGTSTLDLFDTLTGQQRRLLRMVVAGQSDSEIAARWLLRSETVRHLRAALMEKLDLHSQADVKDFAQQRGLLSEPGTE